MSFRVREAARRQSRLAPALHRAESSLASAAMALSAKPSRQALTEEQMTDEASEIDERLTAAVRTPGRSLKSSQGRNGIRGGKDSPIQLPTAGKDRDFDAERANKLIMALEKACV